MFHLLVNIYLELNYYSKNLRKWQFMPKKCYYSYVPKIILPYFHSSNTSGSIPSKKYKFESEVVENTSKPVMMYQCAYCTFWTLKEVDLGKKNLIAFQKFKKKKKTRKNSTWLLMSKVYF